MNTTMIDARPIIAMLCEKFPACFAMFEQRRRPLARGIHREIAAAMPTLTKEQISAAMRYYVNNEGYCRACRADAPRINLLGHEVGVVTAAEADNAVARIEGIKIWRKAKKAAKKEAAVKAKAAAVVAAARPTPKGINALKQTSDSEKGSGIMTKRIEYKPVRNDDRWVIEVTFVDLTPTEARKLESMTGEVLDGNTFLMTCDANPTPTLDEVWAEIRSLQKIDAARGGSGA